MKLKAVFLDRDGVINEDGNYVHTIDDFHFINNAIEALKLMKEKGYALVIITNQSGIARGMYTEEDFLQLTEWMDWSLMDRGVKLDGVYYCPHHPVHGVGKYKVDCDCRKPKTGLFMEAAKDCNIDLKGSYMVGDRKSDIEAGKNAGLAKSFLVKTGKPVTAEALSLADGVYTDLMAVAQALPNALVTHNVNDGTKALRRKSPNQGKNIASKEESLYTQARVGGAKSNYTKDKDQPSAWRSESSSNKSKDFHGKKQNNAERYSSLDRKKAPSKVQGANSAKSTNSLGENKRFKTEVKSGNSKTSSPWQTKQSGHKQGGIKQAGKDAGFAPLKRAVNKSAALQETEEAED